MGRGIEALSGGLGAELEIAPDGALAGLPDELNGMIYLDMPQVLAALEAERRDDR